MEYKFVGKEYSEKIADELKQQTLKSIPGTMKLHSVAWCGACETTCMLLH